MDESQPPWSKIKALTEITKALSGNSLKVLELVRKIEKRGEGEVGSLRRETTATNITGYVQNMIYIFKVFYFFNLLNRFRGRGVRSNIQSIILI